MKQRNIALEIARNYTIRQLCLFGGEERGRELKKTDSPKNSPLGFISEY